MRLPLWQNPHHHALDTFGLSPSAAVLAVSEEGRIANILDVGHIQDVVFGSGGAGKFNREAFEASRLSACAHVFALVDEGHVTDILQVSAVPQTESRNRRSESQLKAFELPGFTSGASELIAPHDDVANIGEVNQQLEPRCNGSSRPDVLQAVGRPLRWRCRHYRTGIDVSSPGSTISREINCFGRCCAWDRMLEDLPVLGWP